MKRKLCSHAFFMISALFVTTWGMPQVPGEPTNIQSPTTASLGLYGEMPVSHFTGVPDISIPLYTFSEKRLSVPLSLKYHASGFRPDQHPGWVGAGWSLHAGGVISRTLKDMPDDYDNDLYSLVDPGFWFNYSILNASNWDQVVYMKTVAEDDDMLKDTEPDEFSFSFPGGSGTFYLDHTRTWKVKSDRPVKVVFNNQFLDVPFTAPSNTAMQTYGNTKSFAGFTIIDENGTQFIYGGSTSAIEYEIGFFSQHLSEWIAQSWHLTKITDVYGNEINLTYERDSYINQMYISVFNHLLTRTLNSGGVFNPQPACSSMSWHSLEASFQGKLIAPVYLKSIYGSASRIDFQRSTSTELRYGQSVYDQKYTQYNDEGNHLAAFLPILAGTAMLGYPQVLDELQWKKLDKIDVKDDAGAVVKSFAFTYTSSTAERLRLLSLKEYGKTQDASKPPYQFFYDSSVPLPGYLANKTDHWGFYNGTFASLLPVSTYYYNYYNFKEPNSTYLLAGTLNKIVYPTGGVTEFTFEPHRYSKRLQFVRSQGIDPSYNTNTLAGGIRIKKIVSYDPNNADAKTSKEYFYVRNFSNAADPGTLMSSGVLGGQIKYYFDDYRSIAFNDNGINYSQSIFSSQSVLPACSNSQGSHVGYSEVIEKDADGGYTKYYFSNFETGNVDEPANSLQVTRTAYEPYTSVEAERGQLLKEELFSADDIRLKQRDISYIALNKSNEFVRAMSARYFNVCPSSAVSCSEGVAYKNYTYSYLPVSEIVTTYDETGANPQVRVKRYEYDPGSRLCRSESVTDSKGLTTTVEYKYPFDFSLAGTVTNAAALGIRYLQDNGVTSWPVETIVALSDGGANSKVISSTYSRFSSTQAVPVKKFTLDVSEPIQGFSSSSVSGGSESIDSRYSEKVSFDIFDVFGNMTQMHKQDDVNEVVVWGYNGQYPVAKVIGSDYAAVMSHLTPSIINSPSNDLTMRNELNKIRTNIPGALVTTYTYMPLVGMTSETGPGGQTFFYEYDNFQRLKCVKDHDGNVTKTFTYNFRP